MKFIQHTVTGPRKENEDALFVREVDSVVYACIADGVGGSKNGKQASAFVVEKFSELVNQNSDIKLNDFMLGIHQELISLDTHGATTFTCLIIENYKLKFSHAGDSRICILRGNGIKQLTEEQNEAGRLYREGHLSLEDKKNYPRKNIIESVLGIANKLTIQSWEFVLESGDRILLSTDGFHDLFSKTELRDLSKKYRDMNNLQKILNDELEKRELFDNTSYIIIEI